MLTMIRMERIIQTALTFFLCLRSNNIRRIILTYERTAKEAKNKARYLLRSFDYDPIDYRFLSGQRSAGGVG